MPKSELVDLSLTLKHETEKAYLVWDGDREAWLPKSMVEFDGETTFTIPVWLAKDKELI